MIDRRIAICVVASVGAHLTIRELLAALPPRAHTERPRTLEVRIVEPPDPPPLPEPAPEPTPPPSPEPVRPPKTQPAPRPTRPASAASPPTATPPTTTTPTTTATSAGPSQPVFGVTMESTTTGGSGPAMPVGNTGSAGAPKAGAPSGTAAAGPPVVPATEVTKMPLPRGRCAGTYTDAAREAGVEGVVVLDLVVDEQGRARDIQVVEGLPHGLTEAAVAAIRGGRFEAGERAGVAVSVRVRGFKIRFVLDER